jgi:hypothetical protein
MFDIAAPFLYDSIATPSSRHGQGPLLFHDSRSKRKALSLVKKLKVEYSVRLETHWNHHVPSPPLPSLHTLRIRRVPHCFESRCQLLDGLTPKTVILEDNIINNLGAIHSIPSDAFPPSITRLIYLCPTPDNTYPPTRLDIPHVVPNLTETTFIFTPRHLWQIHELDYGRRNTYESDRQFTNAIHMFVFHIFHSANPVVLVGLEHFPKESRPRDVSDGNHDHETVVRAYAREIKARIKVVYGRNMYFKPDKLAEWEQNGALREAEMREKQGLFRTMTLTRYVEEELRDNELSWHEAQAWL